MLDDPNIGGGTIDGTPIGSITPASGAFTTLTSTGATNLNTTGGAGTNIGHANSTTTLVGTIRVNTTGSGSTTIGNANSPTTVGGTLGVTGATTLSSLEVTGASTFTGGLSTSKATITGGSIDGTPIGATTASTGRFTTLTSTGNASLGGTLGVTGATTLSSTLAVTGASTFTGLSTFNGGLSTSNATITGGSINGTAIGVTTPSSGAFTTLSSSGATNLGTGSNAATLIGSGSGATTGIGAGTSSGAVTIGRSGGTLTVNSAATFAGNATVGGTLGVMGATTLSSTLAVTGASTFTGLSTFNGGLSTSNAIITGGSINGTPIGATTADTGRFTWLEANNKFSVIHPTPLIALEGSSTVAKDKAQIEFKVNAALGYDSAAVLLEKQSEGMGVGKSEFRMRRQYLCCRGLLRDWQDFFVYDVNNNIIMQHGSSGGLGTHGQWGNVGIGTSTPAYKLQVMGQVASNSNVLTSDARYKTDIRPIVDAMALIERIEGVNYYWNRALFPERNFGSERQSGVIAQQLETVLPHLVTTASDGYKSVNYSGLIPLLIEGAKEQQAQIKGQAAQLVAHAGRLDAQQATLEEHAGRLDEHQRRIGRAENLIGRLGERTGKLEVRIGEVDERIAKLTEQAETAERFQARFDTSQDGVLAVNMPTFQVSNLTAERAEIQELYAKRLEAEQAKFKSIEADEGRMTGKLQAQSVSAQRVATGERELFVSFGTIAPLFEVPEGSHFVVSVTSPDGSFATAMVVRAGGELQVVPSASRGIDLVAQGTQVGEMAPSRREKASWLRTG